MGTIYKHDYYSPTEYDVVAHHDDGTERVVHPHNEAEWIAAGNIPEKRSCSEYVIIVNGEPAWHPNKNQLVWNTLAAAKLAEITALRDSKIAAGIPYQFPDNAVGTIQTRDLADSRNILTNVVTAIILQGAGETRAIMSFRDTENVTHMLTPAQMLTMGAYAAQQGQVIYSASWTLKDMIAIMTIEQLQAFDVAANWPS
jgi:hypothetical protein